MLMVYYTREGLKPSCGIATASHCISRSSAFQSTFPNATNEGSLVPRSPSGKPHGFPTFRYAHSFLHGGLGVFHVNSLKGERSALTDGMRVTFYAAPSLGKKSRGKLEAVCVTPVHTEAEDVRREMERRGFEEEDLLPPWDREDEDFDWRDHYVD